MIPHEKLRPNSFVAASYAPCWCRRGRIVRAPRLAAVAALFALGIAAPVLAAGTFYVDGSNPGASDTGPGSEAIPYRTITTAVNKTGGPGTTIIVKPSVYREQVTVSASGASGNPLQIRASEPGAIVDGSEDYASPGQWAVFTGSVWVAAGVDWKPLDVFVDGARLDSMSVDPASLPSGSYVWVDGAGLYVNLGGDNPGTHATFVGRRDNGFRITGKNDVTVDGFEVRYTQSHGIYVLAGSTDITVRQNHVHSAGAHGIAVSASSNVLVELNQVSKCGDHGINLIDGATGCAIQDNESFQNARVTQRAAVGIMLFASPGNLIQRNRLHHNEDSGMEIVSGSIDNVVLQNISWSNGDHGFGHNSSTGTTLVGNVAWDNASDGISVEGSATGTRIYNCISVENGIGNGRFNLFVDNGSVNGFVSNYNIFWNSIPQKPIKYSGTSYLTIQDYSLASGNDTETFQANPGFMDAAQGDFRLTSGSKAIDSANSGVPNWPLLDANLQSRRDDPATPNTGIGPITYADRGALEFDREGPVAVGAAEPANVQLSRAYPNPARGAVAFTLELKRAARVEWIVTDVQGRVVRSETLNLGAGRSTLRWDGRSADGRRLPAGLYGSRVRVEDASLSRWFTLLR